MMQASSDKMIMPGHNEKTLTTKEAQQGSCAYCEFFEHGLCTLDGEWVNTGYVCQCFRAFDDK